MLIGVELLEGLILRKSALGTRPSGRPVEASLGRKGGVSGDNWHKL
jgi:hypothetical protein